MVALLLVCGALLLGPLGPELRSLPSCQPQPTGLPVCQPPSPAEHTQHRAGDGEGGKATPGGAQRQDGGRQVHRATALAHRGSPAELGPFLEFLEKLIDVICLEPS